MSDQSIKSTTNLHAAKELKSDRRPKIDLNAINIKNIHDDLESRSFHNLDQSFDENQVQTNSQQLQYTKQNKYYRRNYSLEAYDRV